MADYRVTGAQQINHWLWSKLQDFVYNGTDLAFAKYGTGPDQVNLTPFVPTQQTPEFKDIVGGAPFIVYNYTIMPYAEWWECRENCAYVIYDNNEERLRAIHNYLVDLLKRKDWTAREINTWITDPAWDFKTISVTTATGPSDFSDEGGFQGAMVVIQYDYTHELIGTEGNGLRA